MKVEIDLTEIFIDENGAETISQSVRRQVTDAIIKNINQGVEKKIDEAVAITISKNIENYLIGNMDSMLTNIMDTEYTIVTKWGEKEKTTTFRKQIIESLTAQLQFKDDGYSSNRNSFTQAVYSVAGAQLEKFKKDFNGKVDEVFTKKAFEYALDCMKQKLKIS